MKSLLFAAAAYSLLLLHTLGSFRSEWIAPELAPRFPQIRETARKHADALDRESPLSAPQRQSVLGVLQAHREPIQARLQHELTQRETYAALLQTKPRTAKTVVRAAAAVANAKRERDQSLHRLRRELRPHLTAAQAKHLQRAFAEILPLLDRAMASPSSHRSPEPLFAGLPPPASALPGSVAAQRD